MARNSDSTSGMAEDLIRAFVQFGCAEIHAKTLYEKATAELENGIVEVTNSDILQEQLDKIEAYREDIEAYADLRRKTMRKVFDMYDGDKELWCQAKHLGVAMMTLFEAYQASDDDPDLLQMAYEANKAFVKAMTRFLGAEVGDCAACFSDFLKGEN